MEEWFNPIYLLGPHSVPSRAKVTTTSASLQ